ncbi:MAG: hypothetical protein OHK0039_15360 [Bacteroidia bacterium]
MRLFDFLLTPNDRPIMTLQAFVLPSVRLCCLLLLVWVGTHAASAQTGTLQPAIETDTATYARVAAGIVVVYDQGLLPLTPPPPHILPLRSSRGDTSLFARRLGDYFPLTGPLSHLPADAAVVWAVFPESTADLAILSTLAPVVLVCFGVAELPQPLPPTVAALVRVPGDSPLHQDLAAQALMGALPVRGRLDQPWGGSAAGAGTDLPGGQRLGFAPPEAAGYDRQVLRTRIDSLVQQGIDSAAFPGCQLLLARQGRIIHYQAYGYHSYDRTQPVQLRDLYDMASITKIAGPLPALMRLQGEGLFDPDGTLGQIAPMLAGSDMGALSLREVLAHQARLVPYISQQRYTLRPDGRFRCRTIRPDSSARYPVKVAPGHYLHWRYAQVMLRRIRRTPLRAEPGYLYSGLSFFFYPDYIARTTGRPYEDYLQETCYGPLGSGLCYNPWRRHPLTQMPPTEYDSVFRRQLVRGYVHDEAAAMFGGVSGNAGLFGSALDLAKLMQLYLNDGRYGGAQLLQAEVVAQYRAYAFAGAGNRRGLGFDKPPLSGQPASYCAPSASAASFGHSGFTGTYTWADPANGSLMVLLSNRVHPDRGHQQLYELRLREQLHEVVYVGL